MRGIAFISLGLLFFAVGSGQSPSNVRPVPSSPAAQPPDQQAKARPEDAKGGAGAAPFAAFEKQLLVRVAVLGACLIRLFLTARHERLDV